MCPDRCLTLLNNEAAVGFDQLFRRTWLLGRVHLRQQEPLDSSCNGAAAEGVRLVCRVAAVGHDCCSRGFECNGNSLDWSVGPRKTAGHIACTELQQVQAETGFLLASNIWAGPIVTHVWELSYLERQVTVAHGCSMGMGPHAVCTGAVLLLRRACSGCKLSCCEFFAGSAGIAGAACRAGVRGIRRFDTLICAILRFTCGRFCARHLDSAGSFADMECSLHIA